MDGIRGEVGSGEVTPSAASAAERSDAERAPQVLAAGGEGGLSNTPSQKTMAGGEDWLSVSLYVDHQSFDSLAARLDKAQAAALMGHTTDETQFGDIRFMVAASGARQGNGPKATWMRWKLKSENGLLVLVGNRPQHHATQPNMSVQVGSILLMQVGAPAAWGMIQHVVEAMGGRIFKDKLSRVDACVDLPGVSVAELVAAYRENRIVTRGRNRSDYSQSLPSSPHPLPSSCYSHRFRPTGFCIGRSPILVRAYDKLTETANQPEKRALLIANRWGGEPQTATRIEFQLGRERLKTYGVDSVADWFAKRGAVCNELMRSWCRVTAGEVDRKHAGRTPLHPIWEMAAEKFAEWCNAPLDVELTPLDRIEVDTSKQMKQVVGVLSGNFARVGKPIENNDHFMREVEFHIREAIGDRDMAEVVRRKALERGIAPMGRYGREAS